MFQMRVKGLVKC